MLVEIFRFSETTRSPFTSVENLNVNHNQEKTFQIQKPEYQNNPVTLPNIMQPGFLINNQTNNPPRLPQLHQPLHHTSTHTNNHNNSKNGRTNSTKRTKSHSASLRCNPIPAGSNQNGSGTSYDPILFRIIRQKSTGTNSGVFFYFKIYDKLYRGRRDSFSKDKSIMYIRCNTTPRSANKVTFLLYI